MLQRVHTPARVDTKPVALAFARLSAVAALMWSAFLALFPVAATFADVGKSLEIPRQINIPAGPLADALEMLGDQSGIQIMYEPAVAEGITVTALTGKLTVKAALARLLVNTGLRADSVNNKTVVLKRADTLTSGGSVTEGMRVAQYESTTTQRAEGSAAADQINNSRASTEAADDKVQEILVTAQKRTERLQDVPVPVTAIKAEALLSTDQLRLQDYYTKIPGFSVSPSAVQGSNVLTIRGVTTGSGNPTVGIMVDDVPYMASQALGGGIFVPDFDPGDLARIEVLRGPQGTLYGASNMGGLVKFVTVDPSTAGTSGRMHAGLNAVSNGDEPGYNFRGSINVPLSDTFAVRASGFYRRDPGYIDNAQTGESAVNSAQGTGGQLLALWRPSDAFSLKLSAFVQQLKADGTFEVNVLPGLSDLQQSTLPGTGWNDKKAQAYSAVFKGKLGIVDLTSVTGYNVNSEDDSFDASAVYGAAIRPLFGASSGAALVSHNKQKKFSQELRLTMPLGQRVEWLVGGFYTNEDGLITQESRAVNSASGADLGLFHHGDFPTTYNEYAAFTDLTFQVTDRFDVQVGGRESRIRASVATQIQTGPRFPGNLSIVPASRAKASAFTYLVTPRLKLSEDLMVYARLASGYRTGGPNAGAAVSIGGAPSTFDPDKTENYEVGAKANFLDHRLSVDVSLYYIDWKEIQITVQNQLTGQFYQTNGSRAKSQGVELEAQARPLKGLTVAGWIAYDDAVLTEAFPPRSSTFGVPGDRLPLTARWSGNLSVDQEFPLTDAVSGFLGGALAYVGDRLGRFRGATLPRQLYPSYTKLDLTAGVRYASWTANVFVTNVADKRGVITGGLGSFVPSIFTYIQPRTAGLNISKTF